MKLLQRAILAAVWMVAPALAIDPGLLQFVGSDAKSVAGIYVDRAVGSPIGLFLQSQFGPENRDFQKFMETTGFDPRRDVREVVLIAPDSQKRIKGLVVARGVFNGPQIGAVALSQGGIKESYNGVDIYRTSRRLSAQAFAFPEPQIALLGDAASVKAGLDRRALPSSIEPRLLTKINAAGGRYDAWFASVGHSNMGLGKALTAQQLDVVSGGLLLGSVVQLDAEAVMRTEQDAQALVGMIKLITGMAQMQQQKNPELARLFAILNSAETKIDGSTVQFSASAPMTDIEQFLKPPKRSAQAPRQRSQSRSRATAE